MSAVATCCAAPLLLVAWRGASSLCNNALALESSCNPADVMLGTSEHMQVTIAIVQLMIIILSHNLRMN